MSDTEQVQDKPTGSTRKQKHSEGVSVLNVSTEDKDVNELPTEARLVDETIILQILSKKESRGRLRDKFHVCFYCHKKLKQKAIHFEIMHPNEIEVAKLLALPKNSKQRRVGFGNLLRIGDYCYNLEVLTVKDGELVLVRRPTENEAAGICYNDYGQCPDCLGIMLKKHLWHHMKFGCTVKKPNSSSFRRNPISESTALLSSTFGQGVTADFTQYIISNLKNDNISLICRQDEVILHFVIMQFEKYHEIQAELIRQSMRQLARRVRLGKSTRKRLS